MAMQTFVGKITSSPRVLETTKNHRKVVHIRVSFMPDIDINTGKLPTFEDDSISSVDLSFWDENMQEQILANPDALVGKMITGYCDNITKNRDFYNGTGYAFVVTPKGKVKPPVFQVISQSSAPQAPVAPV